MHRTAKGFIRALALVLMLVIMTGTIPAAYADINYSGYVSLRLMDGEPKAGVDTSYKLTIRKSGNVTAVLTNKDTGAQTTVLNNGYDSAQNILLTVPGHLIENGHHYSLDVTLRRGGAIGSAVHTFSTVQISARVDSLSVTSSFSPIDGETFRATFALPYAGNVTAVVKDSTGAQVAVIAQNAPHIACAHALTWNGVTSDGQMAPAGNYTFEITCSNGAGISPVVSAPFRITGDTSGMITGHVQGSIQSLLLTAQPEDGENPTFIIRTSHAGNYTLKIKDSTSGRSYKFTGKLQAGMNTFTPNFACVGGHRYVFQMVQQVSRKNAGKAQVEFTAHMDPPSISISAPSKLQAGYGAALPIQYTMGTRGQAVLFVTDLSYSALYWSVHLDNQSKGAHTYYWNGRGNDGSLLPSGTYYLVSESHNAVGSKYGNAVKLQYDGAAAFGTPVTQGVISVFGAAENPEPVERTPIKFRYQSSVAGDLKITVRDVTNNGQPVVVYNEKTAAGAHTITLPGDHFGVSTYEIEATLTYKRKTAGRAVAYVKPYLVMPAIENFVCEDKFESEWGSSYEMSFDTASTGYLHVRIEKGTSGQFVRYLEPGTYTAAGHHSYYWDGRDDAGNMVPAGDYRVNICYIDSYGNHSNFALKQLHFTGDKSTAEALNGYTAVGVGNHKTPIKIYTSTDARRCLGTTYGISATFNVLKDLGDWLYVETSAATGDPIKGYVQANRLQKVTLTSPYRIEINISRVGPNAHTMYVYHNDVLIDQFKISAGKKEGSTPTGTFCLLDRKPYFTVSSAGAICYDALRVVGGVCIHRIPEINGSYRSTQRALGSPASAGCIRVPIEKSTWLYETIPDTTIIRSYRSAN